MDPIIRLAPMSQERRSLSRNSMREATPMATNAAGVHPDGETPEAADEGRVLLEVERLRREMSEQLRAEVSAARDKAVQQGRQEGLLKGLEEGKRSFVASTAKVDAVAEALAKVLKDGIDSMEDIAVAIAFEAVCKILGDAVLAQDVVRGVVRNAVQGVRNSERLAIRLCPSDLALIREGEEERGAVLPYGNVEWIADEAIDMGGCIVQTDSGSLDARLATQLEQLHSVLLAARRAAFSERGLVRA